MGWIVGALLQRRWSGVLGFALVMVGIFLPVPKTVRVIVVAFGALLIITAPIVAKVAETRRLSREEETHSSGPAASP